MRNRNKPKPLSLENIVRQYWTQTFIPPKVMRKQARREANLALQQSARELRTTFQREKEALLREQYAQGAWAGVLRGMGDEGSPEMQRIKDEYARAAGIPEATVKGFIAPTIAQQQQNVTAGQEASQALAGYTGDIGTGAPAQNAAVLNYLASLPTGTLQAQAEAAAKGFRSAAAQAGAPFALREAQLGQTIRELRDEYLMGRQTLASKRPALVEEALARREGGRRSDFASIVSALGLIGTQANQLAGYGLDVRETNIAARENKRKAMAARGMDLNGNPLPGYYRHPSGRILKTGEYIAGDGSVQRVPQGWKVGPGGKLVKAPYPSSGGGGGAKAVNERRDYLEDLRKDMLDAAQSDLFFGENPFLGTVGPLPKVTRAQVRKYLMQNFAQAAISRYPGQRGAIDQMVNQILNNLGFKK